MDTTTHIISNLMPLWDWLIYALFSVGIIFYNIKRNKEKPILRCLVIIYFIFVLLLTIITRTQKPTITAKMIPFWSWYEVLIHHNIMLFEENILNILMLLPLGIMLKLLTPNFKIKNSFYFGLVLSATIEVTQLIFRLGLFEWDDMIHNTLGCVLGTLIAENIMQIKKLLRTGNIKK